MGSPAPPSDRCVCLAYILQQVECIHLQGTTAGRGCRVARQYARGEHDYSECQVGFATRLRKCWVFWVSGDCCDPASYLQGSHSHSCCPAPFVASDEDLKRSWAKPGWTDPSHHSKTELSSQKLFVLPRVKGCQWNGITDSPASI